MKRAPVLGLGVVLAVVLGTGCSGPGASRSPESDPLAAGDTLAVPAGIDSLDLGEQGDLRTPRFPFETPDASPEVDLVPPPDPEAPLPEFGDPALDAAWEALLRSRPRVPPAGGQEDDWLVDGDNLTAAESDSGQVLRITAPRIRHGTLRIAARDAFYQPDRERLHLVGDVLFVDLDYRGRSDQAIYSQKTEILHAMGGVILKTDTLEVRGRECFFYRGRNSLVIRGDVEGRRAKRRMTADEAEWFQYENEIHMRGHAEVVDEEEGSRLIGERVIYDLDDDRAYVPDRPMLVINPEENTIRISGRKLWVDPDGNARTAGDVEILRGGVIAQADSAVFFRNLHRAVLVGNPTVRERDGVLKGDTLFMVFDEDEVLRRVDVHGHAHVRFAPRDSARLGEVSTVRGDSLNMYFSEGVADSVIVFGNARSTYEPAPNAGDSGTNAVKGDSISIYLDEDGVDQVHVNGNAKGVYTFSPKKRTENPEAAGDTLSVPRTEALAVLPDSLAGPDSLDAETREEFQIEGVRASKDRVLYSANKVVYRLDEKTVDLRGNTVLDYGPLTLTAGKVRFYADRKYLDAEDNPVLTESGREIVGQRMDYNLDSGEGTIDGGRTRAEEGYIYAQRLRQVGDNDYIARTGNFTTCDLADKGEDPHFHFTSNRMRIYMQDKVVAKPVTLYIRDIPVFALPFYVFSVRKGRQSGLLTPDLDFGLGGSSGRFFRNLGYYWAASQYFDLTFSNQYAERDNRYVGTVSGRYAKRYLMNGSFSVRRGFGGGQSDWDIVGDHKMTLGAWRVTGRAEFRDRDFRNEDPLGPDFGARLDRRLISDISASRNFDWGGNLSLTARREKDIAAELDDFNDELVLTETLPRYSFNLNSRTLGRLPDASGEGGRWPALANVRIGFSSSGSSVRTERERTTITPIDTVTADTTFALIGERNSSATHRLTVSDTRKLLGALNISPQVSATERWVDREFSATDTTKKFARAATWSASMGLNTTLYGTFPGLGPVKALRHTFRPGATFSYQPEFSSLTYTDTTGAERNRFPGISASESKRVSLSVENSVQAKVASGEDTRRMELFRWSLSTSYDFVQAERGERAWSDIRSVVDLSQVSGIGLNFNSVHDPYRQGRFKSFNVTGGYSLSGSLPGDAPEEAPTASDEIPEDSEDPLGDELAREREEDDGSAYGARPSLSGSGARRAGRTRGGGLNWNAGFSFSYGGSRNFEDVLNPTASINARATVQLTKNWSVSYDNRWDITQSKILGENLSIRRDLHCWEAQFTRSRLGDETSFYFRINVKELSDVKYELGRRGGTGLSEISSFLP